MENKKKPSLVYDISLAFQLGFLVAIPLVGFLVLGVFLDKKFSSSPIFTLLLTIVSLIFVSIEVYYYLLPFLKKKEKKK